MAKRNKTKVSEKAAPAKPVPDTHGFKTMGVVPSGGDFDDSRQKFMTDFGGTNHKTRLVRFDPDNQHEGGDAVYFNITNRSTGINDDHTSGGVTSTDADHGLFLGYESGLVDGTPPDLELAPGMAFLCNQELTGMGIITGGEIYLCTHDGANLKLVLHTDTMGNVIIGAQDPNTGLPPTADPDAEGALVLRKGTAPTGNGTGGVVHLWAEDVSGDIELRVRDAQSHVTTLSPHNRTGLGSSRAKPLQLDWTMHQEGRSKDDQGQSHHVSQTIDVLHFINETMAKFNEAVEKIEKAVPTIVPLKLPRFKVTDFIGTLVDYPEPQSNWEVVDEVNVRGKKGKKTTLGSTKSGTKKNVFDQAATNPDDVLDGRKVAPCAVVKTNVKFGKDVMLPYEKLNNGTGAPLRYDPKENRYYRKK